MPSRILAGSQPALCILSDVHIGADGHAGEELGQTLEWLRRNSQVQLFLAGDLADMGLPVNGDKAANAKILGQTETPTDQILAVKKTFAPFADRIVGFVGGNHEARGVAAAMIDVSAILANALGVPMYVGAAAIRFRWGRDHQAVGVIGHGRSGGANYWREFQSKLLPLYPDADFYSLGHTHHLASKEIAGLRLDNNGDEVIRRQYFIRSGNYMRRSGSAYSQEAMYAPLPQGSPIVWFRSDGTVDPDVETLRYWSL
jgi:hypothetical protein